MYVPRVLFVFLVLLVLLLVRCVETDHNNNTTPTPAQVQAEMRKHFSTLERTLSQMESELSLASNTPRRSVL